MTIFEKIETWEMKHAKASWAKQQGCFWTLKHIYDRQQWMQFLAPQRETQLGKFVWAQ